MAGSSPMPPEPARPCDNETHGHVIEAHDRLVQSINALAHGGQVSSYLLTVDEWDTVKTLGERINRLTMDNAALRAALERFCQTDWYDPEYERCWYCQASNADAPAEDVIHEDECVLLQGLDALAAAAPAGTGEMP